MLAVTDLVLVLVGLILAVPVLTILVQVLMTLPRWPQSTLSAGRRPRVAVLVPAHNEQDVIKRTLASISRQLETGDRVVVVADNCSDHTADMARQLGAEVTIRLDPALRGKGYALDYGLKFLEQTGIPDVVVFIDADCQIEDGCIDRLARLCVQSMRPTQATYLMNPPSPPRKTASLVAFAWKVKDFVRPLGWHRLGFPCQLAGSGMAFPWEVVRLTDLASGHLAEDLKQGLDLALVGKFPLFCPEAVVTSDVIAGGTASQSQRARWEHGSIETMLRYLPRLFVGFCRTGRFALVAMALDLSVPPVALLALALGGYLALTLVFYFVSGAAVPVLLSGVTCALFFGAITLAWWRHGRDILPLRWLAFAPVYAIMKIPLYVKFFINRQREWVRGERERRG
jgi:cellulose synthase/poly-beta-1,6-N-acetylglucosamine synthase-like glycosyltransferase